MPCQRCQGLMVMDHLMDMQDGSGHLWLCAWRCMNCGEVVDPEITRHRLAQQSRRAGSVKRRARISSKTWEAISVGV